jgi:hypothetical protein
MKKAFLLSLFGILQDWLLISSQHHFWMLCAAGSQLKSEPQRYMNAMDTFFVIRACILKLALEEGSATAPHVAFGLLRIELDHLLGLFLHLLIVMQSIIAGAQSNSSGCNLAMSLSLPTYCEYSKPPVGYFHERLLSNSIPMLCGNRLYGKNDSLA